MSKSPSRIIPSKRRDSRGGISLSATVPRGTGTADCTLTRHTGMLGACVPLTFHHSWQHLALQLRVVGLEACHAGEPDAQVAPG